MATAHFSPVYDYLLTFLVEKATPQEILGFTLPQPEQDRAIFLLDKQDESSLSPDEKIELEQMRQVDLLVSGLKAKALAALQKS